jgi:hypothetical protein
MATDRVRQRRPIGPKGLGISFDFVALATQSTVIPAISVPICNIAMQNTRLTILVDGIVTRLDRWFRNPWRRLSLQLLSLLLGFFLGSSISAVSGQAAQWDTTVAGLVLLFTEVVSRWVYRRPIEGGQRPLAAEMLNNIKIGLTYSLFVDAFKLGS